MKSPSTVNKIQILTGRAVALNRFLSRFTDKCRPFFKALKKGQRDKWEEECEVAFLNLKTYLTSTPLLLKPVPVRTCSCIWQCPTQLSTQLSFEKAGGLASDILHTKSSPQCRDMLPEISKAHSSSYNFREKAATLLPGSSSHCHYQLSFEINPPWP
ncbi:hypothetical protein L3X38_027394 [Prunus dulcis]|uniref:Uncharacterized protein n=1 Tax=Prunus dulcis TaxID=3755 RepID=A0AAD4Z141_PRUDU|nr:hypothetical protein L3X38_027394 [Prunus dulcis]